MFRVVRGKTIRGQQDPHIPLIRINGSGMNASMGLYASQCDLFRAKKLRICSSLVPKKAL